jgi:hypothetical protein
MKNKKIFITVNAGYLRKKLFVDSMVLFKEFTNDKVVNKKELNKILQSYEYFNIRS